MTDSLVGAEDMKEYEVISLMRESMVWCGLYAHDHKRPKTERLHWQDMRNDIAAVIRKMSDYELAFRKEQT